VYDRSKPDGMPRKVMDVSKLAALGWKATTPLQQGFRKAYDWYVANAAHVIVRTGAAPGTLVAHSTE
ncbi:MAG TPA: hypothetical protein VLD36_22845, partial [Burkholderiales bacterium]|nr:hypothetical protein [Burkholderiales bacterium]